MARPFADCLPPGTRVAVVVGVTLASVAVACGSPTPTPPNAATVTTARTQVSQIQSGAATPGSTAQAMATLIAPTLQAAQQTIGPIATSIARSPVQITAVRVASDDTIVDVLNSSGSPVSLDAWTLFLGPNISMALPPINLAAGQKRQLHMGSGATTESDVYLNSPSVGGVSITFAPGQRAVLLMPDHQVASVLVNP